MSFGACSSRRGAAGAGAVWIINASITIPSAASGTKIAPLIEPILIISTQP